MRVLCWLNEHFEETCMIILTCLLVVVMMLQVVLRYAFHMPLYWAEEFCRYCQVWSTFFSLGYCIRRGIMLKVDILTKILPQGAQLALNVTIKTITVAYCSYFFYQSLFTMSYIMNSSQRAPALRIPMWIVYSVIVPGFGLGALRGVQDLVSCVRAAIVKE